MNNKYFLLISVFILLISKSGIAQQDYKAIRYVKELSSKRFSGRGYVNDGHLKASTFIEKKLKQFGYATSIQKCTFPVNTITGETILKINNQTLIPGKEYIFDAGCPTIKGDFEIECISRHLFLITTVRDSFIKNAEGKFILIRPEISEDTIKKNVDSVFAILRMLYKTSYLKITGIIYQDTNHCKYNIRQKIIRYPIININSSTFYQNGTKISIDVKSKLQTYCESNNVIGIIKGYKYPDSIIVISAHYDHLGLMGGTIFPGANDNASGTAMMLGLAKYFACHPQKFSIVCIAFTGEELGMLGSKHYIENPLYPLNRISFLLNFDMVGTGEEGIKVVNGSDLKRQFYYLTSINDSLKLLPLIKPRVQGCISDQCYFFKKGIPCFTFLTMGGSDAYHDAYDTYNNLSFCAFNSIIKLSIEFIAKLQE